MTTSCLLVAWQQFFEGKLEPSSQEQHLLYLSSTYFSFLRRNKAQIKAWKQRKHQPLMTQGLWGLLLFFSLAEWWCISRAGWSHGLLLMGQVQNAIGTKEEQRIFPLLWLGRIPECTLYRSFFLFASCTTDTQISVSQNSSARFCFNLQQVWAIPVMLAWPLTLGPWSRYSVCNPVYV